MGYKSVMVAVLAATLGACGSSEVTDISSDATEATDPPPVSSADATSDGDVPRAKDGDSVEVHYTGTLDDGTEFDSSVGRSPLAFVVASGQVIKGFDDAVRDLAVGETRTLRIEPVDAYGEFDPAKILEIPLDQLPEGVTAGNELVASTGQRMIVSSVDTEAGVAMVDSNHALAGKALTFWVELVSLMAG